MTRKIRHYSLTLILEFKVFGRQEPCLRTYTMPDVMSGYNLGKSYAWCHIRRIFAKYRENLSGGKSSNLTIFGSGIQHYFQGSFRNTTAIVPDWKDWNISKNLEIGRCIGARGRVVVVAYLVSDMPILPSLVAQANRRSILILQQSLSARVQRIRKKSVHKR